MVCLPTKRVPSVRSAVPTIRLRRRTALVLAALAWSFWQAPASAQDAGRGKGSSGLTVPRFASLKVDRVNLRQGPGTDYPTAWVFQRAGWPLEILREFEGWRQVRDVDDTVGWVQGAMLSGRRTALVRRQSGQSDTVPLRADNSERSEPVAHLEPGIVAAVLGCDGRWCRISVGDVRGYIEQSRLWGVYPGENLK